MPHRTAREPTSTASVLSVRVSADERALLEQASEQAKTNLSDFVRRKALDAAELSLLERSVVTISADDWLAFEAWVAKPGRVVPALQKLARKPLPWSK